MPPPGHRIRVRRVEPLPGSSRVTASAFTTPYPIWEEMPIVPE